MNPLENESLKKSVAIYTVIDRLRTLDFSLAHECNIPNPDQWPSDINSVQHELKMLLSGNN